MLSIFLLKDKKYKWAINSGKYTGGRGNINQHFSFYSFLSEKVLPSVQFLPWPDNKHLLSDCHLNFYFISDTPTTSPSTYKGRIFWSASKQNRCSKPEVFNLWPTWKIHPTCNLLLPTFYREEVAYWDTWWQCNIECIKFMKKFQPCYQVLQQATCSTQPEHWIYLQTEYL